MLTSQTIVTNSTMDNIPLSFIISDDGGTLLAVSDVANGTIELMNAPVTYINDNDNSKLSDSNLPSNTSLLQFCVNESSGSRNQESILVPAQMISFISNDPHVSSIKEEPSQIAYHISQYQPIRAKPSTEEYLIQSSPLESTSIKSSIHQLKSSTPRRSPGRPKKSDSFHKNADSKCEICGEEFKKKSLYRKHMEHHAEEKPHRCPKCPASFNIPTNFTLHMATHSIGEPKCPECGKRFARKASLKSHMMLHEKEENLFCTECEDAFSTKAQLDAHLKLHNEKWTTDDVRKCKLCHKQFTQPALYRQHIREHYRLQTKLVKQTKRGTRHKTIYKCKICFKTFQKPSQLMRHIRVHTGDKPFKCTICGRKFTQKGSLQIHMSQHDGLKPHACHFCNAKFSQKGNLNAHIHRVHNLPDKDSIFRCTYCSCGFKKLGSLNAHLKRRHVLPNEQEESPKCDSSTSDADMQATVDNVMSQLASLKSEVYNHADSTENDNNDILQEALENSELPDKEKQAELALKANGKTMMVTLLDRTYEGDARKYVTIKQRHVGDMLWFTCTFCQKEFKKPSDLIRHLRIHTQEKPFKCSLCSRSFALKSTMTAHERTHSALKKFPCGSCEKVFPTRSSLTAHTRLHAKSFTCNVCNKCFSGSSLLRNHMRCHSKPKTKLSPEAESLVPQIVLEEPLLISDSGNKISVAQVKSKKQQVYEDGDSARPHKCTMCTAAFRKISHLKQHHRRHTGEKPFKCPICDRKFTSNSVLKTHLHTHEDLRPHSCSVCNAKFTTHSSMKRHLITHSNKRPFMCPYCHKTFKTSVNCRKHMKIHKSELAQQQVEREKMQPKIDTSLENSKDSDDSAKKKFSVPENLALANAITVPFQSQAVNFTADLTSRFESIVDQSKHNLTPISDDVNVNQNVLNTTSANLGITQTLHADETGTITLPNYSGEQTLTAESIREIEETLNQQLFDIGMNLEIGNSITKHVSEKSSLDSRHQQVLSIIYETDKTLENVSNNINTHIFTPQFDTFDMNQISLNDPIDVGIEAATSTNIANLLPETSGEGQLSVKTEFVGINQSKDTKELINSIQTGSELVTPEKKYSKIIAKADTTNVIEIQPLKNKPKPRKKAVDLLSDYDEYCFPCTICDKVFRRESEMLHHVEEHMNTAVKNSVINGSNSIEITPLLQCHMCSKSGFTAHELKEHLNTHQGSKEFECVECSQKFCTNGGLSRHLKMHAAKQQYQCNLCQKVLPNKVQMDLHLLDHQEVFRIGVVEADSSEKDINPVEAKFREISFDKSPSIVDAKLSEQILLDPTEFMERLKNLKMEGKEEKKPEKNKCEFCPKTFRKPSDLTRHLRTHTGERPFKCPFCSKSFAVKCTLDCHLKIHNGQKTFSCHVCNSFFATKGSLKVHMRLHTGSKPFKCLICDMRFRTSGHRKVHLLSHIKEQKENQTRKRKQRKTEAIASVVADVENAIESIANENTISLQENKEDQYSNADAVTVETSALTDQITFNPDGTIVNNNSVLSVSESNQLVANLHFLLANGLISIQSDGVLTIQDSVLPGLANLQLGNLQEEFVESNDSENIIITQDANCLDLEQAGLLNMVFQVGDNSNSSIPVSDDFNSNIPSYEAVNSASSPSKVGTSGRRRSIRRECEYCGKVFPKPCQLERHKRIHTGDRPFKCELCEKSFTQKNTLLMHQKHHTGDRPHNCPYCTYSFSQKGNLQTHIKRAHQLDMVDGKKFWKEAPSKFVQENAVDPKLLSLDDISFVDYLS